MQMHDSDSDSDSMWTAKDVMAQHRSLVVYKSFQVLAWSESPSLTAVVEGTCTLTIEGRGGGFAQLWSRSLTTEVGRCITVRGSLRAT